MPRSGPLGTYTLPGAQATQQPNTPIPSAVNNQGYSDIEQTFNTPTPVAYGGTNASTALGAVTTLLSGLYWGIQPVGSYYEYDGVTGVELPPISNSAFAWIELTAGLTGSGQFNNGKLGSESVSGSAPLVLATAQVTLASSPMVGETIRLLNSENRHLRPATTAGGVANDQFQGHTFSDGTGVMQTRVAFGSGGLLAISNQGGTPIVIASNGSNGTPRVGSSTEVKHQNVRVFRCIKNIWS